MKYIYNDNFPADLVIGSSGDQPKLPGKLPVSSFPTDTEMPIFNPVYVSNKDFCGQSIVSVSMFTRENVNG